MKIITAQFEHLNDIARLNAEVQNLHVGFAPEVFKKPRYNEIVALFEEFLKDENRTTFLCYEDNEPVGYISLQISGHEGHALCYPQKWIYIDQIGVKAAYQGKGIGKRLIEAAKAFAKRNQIKRVILDVWRVNENAKGFFQTQGFNTMIERMEMEI